MPLLSGVGDAGAALPARPCTACAGQDITLKLGFSHDTIYTVPDSMRAFLPDATTIGLYGIDKQQARCTPPKPTQGIASCVHSRPPDLVQPRWHRQAV